MAFDHLDDGKFADERTALADLLAVEDRDAHAALQEEPRGREADDAGADDDDVPRGG